MKAFTLFILLVIFMSILSSQEQPGPEPSKFPFGSVPFGESIENVLRLVDGAKIYEADNVSIEAIDNYGLLDNYFKDGLYSRMGIGTYFKSNLTKKYTITYEGWENIAEINLYFVKKYNSDGPYTLFFVRKVLMAQELNYKNVFDGMKNAISERLGATPELQNTRYQTFEMAIYKLIYSALVGFWDLEKIKVFLLVSQDYIYSSKTNSPEILMLSNAGWEKYIAAIEASEEEKRLKEKNEAKSLIDDF